MNVKSAVKVSAFRSRIIAAARQHFEQFGYRRASIADIARDAGVASGTLYRYFKNKEDLFLAVVRGLSGSWVKLATEVLAEPSSAIERLACLGRASVQFNQENKLLSYILARDTEFISAPLVESLNEELTTQHIKLMAAVISDGIREGSLRKVDPERAAYILFLAGHALYDQKRYPYEDILPLFAEITMGGLIPR